MSQRFPMTPSHKMLIAAHLLLSREDWRSLGEKTKPSGLVKNGKNKHRGGRAEKMYDMKSSISGRLRRRRRSFFGGSTEAAPPVCSGAAILGQSAPLGTCMMAAVGEIRLGPGSARTVRVVRRPGRWRRDGGWGDGMIDGGGGLSWERCFKCIAQDIVALVGHNKMMIVIFSRLMLQGHWLRILGLGSGRGPPCLTGAVRGPWAGGSHLVSYAVKLQLI